MSILADHEIRRRALESGLIHPYRKSQQAPSSYDVLLGSSLQIPQASHRAVDLRKPVSQAVWVVVMDDNGYVLRPNGFVLGVTREWVNIPPSLVCRIEGKSSLARIGLQIHSAGYIDPGYRGRITLEITNFGPDPIILAPDVMIAQLSFEWMSSSPLSPYAGRYQGSAGVVESRYGHKLVAPGVVE